MKRKSSDTRKEGVKQKLTSGDNSINIQAGRDVNYSNMTASDVHEVIEQVLRYQDKSVSIDYRLIQVAKEQGKTLKQLKDEIEE